MSELIEKIAYCIEFGKINLASPYPPNMKGQVGADELTKQAIDEGVDPDEILNKGMVVGMDKVGQKFSENKVFVPQMLMSAKAMSTAMVHIKPFFQSGAVKRKGKFILGTVAGDLHDIGKNLVGMMMEGAGFEVINLGINNPVENYLAALEEHQPDILGMSALLTTTMPYMKVVIDTLVEKGIRDDYIVLVGGAPLNEQFAMAVGADAYCRDAGVAVETALDLIAKKRA